MIKKKTGNTFTKVMKLLPKSVFFTISYPYFKESLTFALLKNWNKFN